MYMSHFARNKSFTLATTQKNSLEGVMPAEEVKYIKKSFQLVLVMVSSYFLLPGITCNGINFRPLRTYLGNCL